MKIYCIAQGTLFSALWWPNENEIPQTGDVCTHTYIFQWSCMDVRVGLWRKLSAKELMLLNCGVGEDSWESLGLQGGPTSPS